jgi:hypothetical protein
MQTSAAPMNSRWVAVVVLLCLMLAGGVHLLRRRASIRGDKEFAIEFADKLRTYVNSEGHDGPAYAWLVHRSTKMQTQMGPGGIYGAYRPPFANFQYRDYPIVMNMLPDLRQAYGDHILARSQAGQYANALFDALVRHVGVLDDREAAAVDALRNPLVWLREGAAMVVAFPVDLLAGLGIMSSRMAVHWRAGWFVRVVSGLVALTSLVSAVIGIVIGWAPFIAWCHALAEKWGG